MESRGFSCEEGRERKRGEREGGLGRNGGGGKKKRGGGTFDVSQHFDGKVVVVDIIGIAHQPIFILMI